MKKQAMYVLLTATLTLMAGLSTQAATLEKIKSSGAVTMGVRESSGALSYTLGDGKFVGFHVEICEQVLADLKKNLQLCNEIP